MKSTAPPTADTAPPLAELVNPVRSGRVLLLDEAAILARVAELAPVHEQVRYDAGGFVAGALARVRATEPLPLEALTSLEVVGGPVVPLAQASAQDLRGALHEQLARLVAADLAVRYTERIAARLLRQASEAQLREQA